MARGNLNVTLLMLMLTFCLLATLGEGLFSGRRSRRHKGQGWSRTSGRKGHLKSLKAVGKVVGEIIDTGKDIVIEGVRGFLFNDDDGDDHNTYVVNLGPQPMVPKHATPSPVKNGGTAASSLTSSFVIVITVVVIIIVNVMNGGRVC